MLRWRSKSNKRLADLLAGSHVHNHHTTQDTLQRYTSQLLDHKDIHIHIATWPYFLRNPDRNEMAQYHGYTCDIELCRIKFCQNSERGPRKFITSNAKHEKDTQRHFEALGSYQRV
jgi:hypothetical protein